jgi:peptidyl-prolyl cis-trans isomerase SurA
MKRRYDLAGVVIILAVFLFPQLAGGETFNRVVAIVNEDVITLFEVDKKIYELTGYNPEEIKNRDEKSYIDVRKKVLERMIDERITQEKIKELGIVISPKKIDAAIERVKKDNKWTHEDLLSNLKKRGITYDSYRKNMKEELERYQLVNEEINSKIIIRDEQINAYYDAHVDQFQNQAYSELAMIVLKQEDSETEAAFLERGQDILTRLKKGENFAALARQYSQGPGASEGGRLGKFKMEQLEPEMQKIVQELPQGGISDLIIRPGGIQIIKLITKAGGGTKTRKEVRNAIYSILYRKEMDKRYKVWIKELRDKTYTKIVF